MSEDNILKKAADSLFSTSKTTLYLALIFAFGFILRLIAAVNLGVTADDMHHVTFAINFLQAGRLTTYEQSAGLWHAFTSVMYSLSGTTQLASRIAPLVFGSFSILVIYLLTKEFFSKKTALIAAFLLAIAPFHIKNTIAEMDVMAMFFVLLSMFLFVKALKTNKFNYFLVGGIALGLAIYTKVYPLLFVPSFILYFIYIKRKDKSQILTKNNVHKMLLFLIIAALFAIPALTHNYLLYKDKGFLDLHFTRTLGLGKNNSAEYYSWDPIFERKSSWAGLFFGDERHIVSGIPLLLGAAGFIRKADPINFYLGLIGIVMLFFRQKDKRKYLVFFLLNILFIFPFLAANILLAKHFLFLEILLVHLSALPVAHLNYKFELKNKKYPKYMFLLLLLLSLILLAQLSSGVTHFYGKSHIAKMIEFKEENIPANSLIVADSRIYRGRINWAFQGRPYLEGFDFIQITNSQEQFPGEAFKVETYFFECIPDDCGWGSVKDQPEFNASMESLADFFKENGQLITKINEPNMQEKYYPFVGKEKEIVAVYKADLFLKEDVLSIANQPKNWWIYSVGFEPREEQFDYYKTSTTFDSLLNNFAHLIVWLALILAFISPLYAVYLIYISDKDEVINNNPGV